MHTFLCFAVFVIVYAIYLRSSSHHYGTNMSIFISHQHHIIITSVLYVIKCVGFCSSGMVFDTIV